MKSRRRTVRTRMAGPDHAVVTIREQGKEACAYRREPCEQCPWRRDSPVGAFPAEAYRISANTADDMSDHAFACHMSGIDHPATCAGFLLQGAEHNLWYRLKCATGQIDPDQVGSQVKLYRNYRAMAEANGVAPDDPALKRCRE